MKCYLRPGLALLVSGILVASCENERQREERLARQYCAACHAFPEPALADKKSWRERIMPQMAFRMGFPDTKFLRHMKEDERNTVMASLPAHPMLSEADFDRIESYYQRHAPDSLERPAVPPSGSMDQFEATTFRIPLKTSPLVTLIKTDTVAGKIFVGTRLARLYQFSRTLALEDSFQLPSPPSDVLFEGAGTELLLMGIMDPNDQPRGEIISLDAGNRQVKQVLDSLQRPVHMQRADLNKDGLPDYVVCAFGNYTGALLAYENEGNGRYTRHVLISLPGARKTIVRDLDNDGMPDITALLAQGDEKIVMLHNDGNFDFSITTLLRFPPVYGSSFFEIGDFNRDGQFDILYTNGDNADYSPVLKPYHGVRLYLNEGANTFRESWFHPMHGASQTRAVDFDGDGDLDLAAIAFFPDFTTHPERCFYYFRNDGGTFATFTTPLAATGRWITMEVADLEPDGDVDVLLGALNFEPGVPEDVLARWNKEQASLLVLRNKRQ